MKEPTLAPVYATLYPGLCDVARSLGYALALHGTLTKDLDLVAIPWTEEAVEDEVLVKALKDHVGACLLHEKLAKETGYTITGREGKDPETKPHGRKCWSLHLDNGAYIDLGVMPRSGLSPEEAIDLLKEVNRQRSAMKPPLPQGGSGTAPPSQQWSCEHKAIFLEITKHLKRTGPGGILGTVHPAVEDLRAIRKIIYERTGIEAEEWT